MKVVSILLLLALASCTTVVEPERFQQTEQMQTPPNPSQSRLQPQSQSPALPYASGKAVIDKRVILAPDLDPAIQVAAIQSGTTPNGFLRFQADLQNTSASLKQFDYVVEWLDAAGNELTVVRSVPLPYTLTGHDEASVLAMTAPTRDAKDFRLILMEFAK